MRFLSLEELAERWSIAHTIAVAAWAVAAVLGITLMIRNSRPTYPDTDRLKTYAAENATFSYPENWTINKCSPDKSFIELPGTIKSSYKGHPGYRLKIYGDVVYKCIKDRPVHMDIYSEKIKASKKPCAIGTSTQGERLDNGLYLQLKVMDEQVYAIHIKQNSCFAPNNTVVIGFAFSDPEATADDEEEFGAPWVDKEDFLKTQQYQDIRSLAESIRY
jgi:hypothetical protein